MTDDIKFDTKLGKRTKISFSSMKKGQYPFLDRTYKVIGSGTAIQRALLNYAEIKGIHNDPEWKKCIKLASATSKVPTYSSKELEIKVSRLSGEISEVFESGHPMDANALKILMRASGTFKTVTAVKR